MGQYYCAVVDRDVYETDKGLKLCEQAYKNDAFVNGVAEQIYCRPAKVAWVGDYADTEQWKSKMENLDMSYDEIWNAKERCIKSDFSCKGRYLVNHSTHQYYSMDTEIYEEGRPPEKYPEIWDMHALPLLTAIGNGDGGGDYYGVGSKDVGVWAGDVLSIEDIPPDGYTLVTFQFDYLG